MKYSEMVPTYSKYKYFLKTINKMQVTLIEVTTKETNSVVKDFETKTPTKQILTGRYHLRERIADTIILFYEKANIFLTDKYVLFAQRHNLVEIDKCFEGEKVKYNCFKLTKRGEEFLNLDLVTIAEIDQKEMLLLILEDIAPYSESDEISLSFAIDDFFPLYDSTAPLLFLESRLDNLVDRKLITRRYDKVEDCDYYKITKSGRSHLNNFKEMKRGKSILEKTFFLNNDIEKLKMMKHLMTIDPYEFEHLICYLLTQMGYENVQTTSKVNDNGIDLTGEIKAGTSAVKEIIQVKRWKNNIHRPTIDQLRGVLAISNGIRGSIFTTGDFSQGCYVSAKDDPSLNLINGERLIGLFQKYAVGFTEEIYKRYSFSADTIKMNIEKGT